MVWSLVKGQEFKVTLGRKGEGTVCVCVCVCVVVYVCGAGRRRPGGGEQLGSKLEIR